jgi:uncharacterized protein (TIGR02118 family)
VIKVIGFTSRPGAPDPAAPLAGFLDGDAPIAPAEAGPAGTVVNEILERTRGDLVASAFVEQWWADEATFRAWAAGAGRALQAGSPGDPYWLTVEHVLRQPAIGRGELKILGTAYKLDRFTTDAFFAYWRDVHGPISARVPGLRGYVVSEVQRPLRGRLHADGFVEQWWPDAAVLDAANDSPEVAVAWADVANYAETTGTFWLVREHVLRAPVLGRGSLEDA